MICKDLADLVAAAAKQDLPDCKPITFSLGSPASERGFLLPSLKLDSLEQLNSVLPVGLPCLVSISLPELTHTHTRTTRTAAAETGADERVVSECLCGGSDSQSEWDR